MVRSQTFWVGVVVGVGGVWAFHRWVKPMPSTKSA